jgi:excisionase family DNA binding protein
MPRRQRSSAYPGVRLRGYGEDGGREKVMRTKALNLRKTEGRKHGFGCRGRISLRDRTSKEALDMEKLLTIEQLSELLQVKLSTIYQWTHTGFIPHVKLGRLVRFRESDVLEWIKKRQHPGRLRRGVSIRLNQ